MDISLISLLIFTIITILYFVAPSIGKPTLTLSDLVNDESKTIIRSLDEYKITPAEMTKIMFENFEDYEACIEKLKNMQTHSSI